MPGSIPVRRCPLDCGNSGDIPYVGPLADMIGENSPDRDNQAPLYLAVDALDIGVGICEALNGNARCL